MQTNNTRHLILFIFKYDKSVMEPLIKYISINPYVFTSMAGTVKVSTLHFVSLVPSNIAVLVALALAVCEHVNLPV